MVEQVTTYITANWVAWLFAGAYAILIALYKKEKQQHKEEREENKAVREGLQKPIFLPNWKKHSLPLSKGL